MIRFAFDVSTALCRDGGLREIARPWGRRWRGRKPFHIRSHRRVSAWMRANQASSVSGAGVQDLKRNDSGRGRCGLESQRRFSLFRCGSSLRGAEGVQHVKDQEHDQQRDRFLHLAPLSARRRDVHVSLVADCQESLAITPSSSPLVERGRRLLLF